MRLQCYTVHMTEQQMRLIHEATKLLKSVQMEDPTLDESDMEELDALVDMSNLNHKDKNIRPNPVGVNGWAL